MVKYPTWNKPVSFEHITQRTKNFTGMHPTMQDRCARLIKASGGKVGWGQGVRTDQQQLQLFLSRHVEDPNGSRSWNGKRWKRVRGSAAAPPGGSMHALGLAADLVALNGDFSWLLANVSDFGLLTFANVNDEPHHGQPVEIDKGRSAYERNGSSWGGLPNFKNVSGGSSRPTTDSSGSASGGTAPTLTPALVARPGDSGPAARVLLEAMIARELLADDDANRNRTYGDSDAELVRKFQGENGLGVDGMVGSQTWGKMLAPVEPGEVSPMVRVMQTTLIVRKLIRDNDANLDGDYGTVTQERVRAFQEQSGIDPIATVGPQTWTALMGVKHRVAVSSRSLEPDEDADIDLDDLDFLEFIDEKPVP